VPVPRRQYQDDELKDILNEPTRNVNPTHLVFFLLVMFFVAMYAMARSGYDVILDANQWAVAGGILTGGWGISVAIYQEILRKSDYMVWPTGKSPINTRSPKYTINPPRDEKDNILGIVHVGHGDLKVKLRISWKAFNVGGTSYLVHLPGYDWVVGPWIEITYIAPDGTTYSRNYSLLEWGPQAAFLNWDTTAVDDHSEIPGWIYDEIKRDRYFRPRSRVHFALTPKYDLWNLEPIAVPKEIRSLAKLEAQERKAAFGVAGHARETAIRASRTAKAFIESPGQRRRRMTEEPEEGEEAE
jgi:hypothetical protein